MPLRPQRVRRTKVYDCNYDIGQRYYKPVVDDLDRKYTGGARADGVGSGLGSLRSALDEAESSLGSSARRVARERDASRELDDLEETSFSRRPRPASALMEDFDSIFESRGSRGAAGGGSSRAALALALEDGEEESSASSRLRAARARAQAIEDEFQSSSVSSRRAKSGLDYSEKQVLDTVGLKNSDITRARQALAENNFGSASISKRTLKVSAVQPGEGDFTKWTKLSDADLEVGAEEDFDSGAAATRARKKAKARLAEIEAELGTDFAAGAAADRARKSRARLADLEAEMDAVADRTAARERRAAGLRALVAENEANAAGESSSSTTSSLRVRKVTSSVQSEKKTVTF